MTNSSIHRSKSTLTTPKFTLSRLNLLTNLINGQKIIFYRYWSDDYCHVHVLTCTMASTNLCGHFPSKVIVVFRLNVHCKT